MPATLPVLPFRYPEEKARDRKQEGLDVTTCIRVQRSAAQAAFHKVFCFSIAWAVERAMQKSKAPRVKKMSTALRYEPMEKWEIGGT